MRTVEAARDVLVAAGRRSGAEQQAEQAAIIEAFRVWWAAEPDEGEFAAVMARVVLFPRILYQMVQRAGLRPGGDGTMAECESIRVGDTMRWAGRRALVTAISVSESGDKILHFAPITAPMVNQSEPEC